MQKLIAVLRGINVGGKRKVLMLDLKEMFRKMEFKNIQTYIQSGNIIFDSSRKEDNVNLSDKIQKQVFNTFGFDVPVIIRNADEMRQALSNNPFPKKGVEIERLYLTFLKEIPAKENLEKIKQYDYSPDQFELSGNNIFGFCSGKYSDSKYTNAFFESKLKVSATTRNWKTVIKLTELATSN